MHQYKTMAQTLLVLSILNLVFAAPVVPREVHDTGDDVVVVAEDVATGSDRRRGAQPVGTTGTTPSQYPSSLSGGSPPHDSLPLDESAPFQGSASSSGPAPLSHLSATGGQMPVLDSTTEASTSAHPLSAAWDLLHQKTNRLNTEASDGPAPAPTSNTEASTSSHRPVPVSASTAEGSTTPHYAQITPDMLHKDPTKKLVAQKFAAFGLLVAVNAVATGIALYSVLHSNHKNSTGG